MATGSPNLSVYGLAVKLLMDKPHLYEAMLYIEHRTMAPPYGRSHRTKVHPEFTDELYAGAIELEMQGLIVPWVKCPFRMIGLNCYLMTELGIRAINYNRQLSSLVGSRVHQVINRKP